MRGFIQEVEIIDNFLEQEEWKKLHHIMMGNGIPWFSQPDSDFDGDDRPQFTHSFWRAHDCDGSEGFPLMAPFIRKLNVHIPVHIKANLTPRMREGDELYGKWHTDFAVMDEFFHPDYKNIGSTAVFYLNDNNGGTELEDGTFVESRANRIVVFPWKMYHRVKRHTSGEWRRVIINFNLIRARMVEDKQKETEEITALTMEIDKQLNNR